MHSRDKSVTNYFLSKPLKDVDNFKYLSVTITKDLSWGNHISITVNKANKVLGSIKCSVGTANINMFSMLYKSLVWPIMEYAVPVWCPYLVKDIHALENVQRRASRLALKQLKVPAQANLGHFYCKKLSTHCLVIVQKSSEY